MTSTRPLIVGQLLNGPHELPWPACVDGGTNHHPGKISGWRRPHLDGQRAAHCGQWLGEGIYGHNKGWAVVRAGEGLLLSTSARPAQGASVARTQMDAAEAVGQLKAAQQLGDVLAQSARQQGAHGLHSHEADQAWATHTAAMDPAA